MESIQRDWEREKELKLYLEWKTAKTKRRRDAAFLELCRRSMPASRSALKYLTKKYNEKRAEHVTPEDWLTRHGITERDFVSLTTLAVMEAGKTFDPERAKDNNRFTTYVYSFAKGRLYDAASVSVATHHTDLDFDDHPDAERSATWKKAGAKRRPIPGGSEDPDQGDRTDTRLRTLFELKTSPGDFGKPNSRGTFLGSLGADALIGLRNFLEQNKERAIAVYGYGPWVGLRADVGILALLERLPPNALRTDPFADKPKDGLTPLQGVAVRVDGKKWDLDLPIRAELLRGEGLSGRATAKRLGMAETSLRDIQTRAKDLGFSLSKFTPHDLDAVARGEKRGRPPKS